MGTAKDGVLMPNECGCGSVPVVQCIDITFAKEKQWQVFCKHCGIGIGRAGDDKDARQNVIEAWNRWIKSPTFAAECAESRAEKTKVARREDESRACKKL